MKNKKSLLFFIIMCFSFIIIANSNYSTAQAATNSYDKVNLNKNSISSSNSSDVSTTDTSDILKISQTSNDAFDTTFTINDTFDFNKNVPSRLCVYAVSNSEDTSIEFYLDKESEPFASVSLPKQKKSAQLNNMKDISVNIADKNIKGTHKISFKINPGENNSNSETYIKSIEFVESSIPVVYFDIDESQGSIAAMNSDSAHATKCTGDMNIQIPANYKCEYTNEDLTSDTYAVEYIRGRGNSTWMANTRKPYKFKLDKKADLFGMGANKHWVLLSNYYENSLLRNKITYWLGDQLSFNFTPQSVFVEVVMNGEYYGIYQLCEQVRVDNSRVEIDDLEKTPDATDADSISGGYLLSMGSWGADGKGFKTNANNFFSIESPSFEGSVNSAQFDYIKNYIQQVEDAIYSPNFKNSSGQHYSDLVDIDTLVDFYWVQELSLNTDIGTGSTYCYKVRDGKLYFGPLWDFDVVAWGNSDNKTKDYLYARYFSWFDQLFKDSYFTNKLKERWPYINKKVNELCQNGGILDQYTNELDIAQKYNFEKFPVSSSGFGFGGGFGDWGNWGFGNNNVVDSFQKEYNDFVGIQQQNNNGWNFGGWGDNPWNNNGWNFGNMGDNNNNNGWNFGNMGDNNNNNGWNFGGNNIFAPLSVNSALESQDPLAYNKSFIEDLGDNIKSTFEKNDIDLSKDDKQVLKKAVNEDEYSATYILEHFAKSNHKEAILFLKTWIKTRAEWINSNIDKFEKLNYEVNLVQRMDNNDFGTKFDPDNGQDIITLSAFANTKIENPKKDGYIFIGWYNEETKEYYDPSSTSNNMFGFGFGFGMNATSPTYKAKYVKANEVVPIEKINLEYKEVYVNFDATTFTINASVLPENSSLARVLNYSIDNKRIASIDNNVLHIYDTGDVTVTVSDPTNDEVYEKCLIHIIDDNKTISDVSTNQKNINIGKGETLTMPITFSPDNVAIKSGSWASKDKNIAYVDDARILHAVSEGTVEIRYFCFDLKKYVSYNVTVGKSSTTPTPSNPPTTKPSNPPTVKPSNPPTVKPSNPPTVKPSNPPTSNSNSAVNAKLTITNDWKDGAVCSITITNNTQKSFTNGWTFEFDFTRSINDMWSANLISKTSNHFVVTNPDWAKTLNKGESYTFSFMAGKDVSGSKISNCILY